MRNSQITEIYYCLFTNLQLYLEKGVLIMYRRTLLKNDNYVIVQYSHYPAVKIHRGKYLTTYHIQKMLAHNKEFDLTDLFLKKCKKEKSPGHFYRD